MYKMPVILTVKNVKSFILGSRPSPDLKIQYLLASQVARRAESKGGRALLVGGCVRDALLRRQGKNTTVKDLDMEVYGLRPSELRAVLIKLAADPIIKRGLGLKRIQLNEVGRQFGIFNLGGLDIALPRTESRTGSGLGRRPEVFSSAELDFEQASHRRDLTINAMALDLINGRVLDAHGGLEDLYKGVLRAVDHRSFGDDPLRVLRAMQFAARFEFNIHSGTLSLCRSIKLNHLAKERVGQEWYKMLLWSRRPSIGIQVADKLSILEKLNPGLARLFKQNKKHSRLLGKSLDHVSEAAGRFKLPEYKRILLLLTVLSYVLDRREAVLFLKQINTSGAQIKACVSLHALLNKLYKSASKLADLKYLIKKIAFDLSSVNSPLVLFDFIILLEALSFWDKKNLTVGPYKIKDFKSEAGSLNVLFKPPAVLLSGLDLLALGVKPGPGLGKLLKQATDVQLRGEFDDARGQSSKRLAMEWVKDKLK